MIKKVRLTGTGKNKKKKNFLGDKKKMCQAFTCVATRKKVYWEAGIDSHEKLKEKFNLNDTKLGNLTPIEILPDQRYKYPYLHPEKKWTLKFGSDFGLAPDWWKSSNESICWTAFKTWKKKVYSQIDLKGILNSISPLKLPAVKKVTKAQIKLLMKWISVLDSGETSIGEDRIKDSVGDSVWNSVRDSLLDSVGDSLVDSVWNSERGFIGLSKINFMRHSVRTFVGAYIISFFPKNKFKTNFNSCIKLWKMGLLPSFDGKTWRLHTGKDAHIIFVCKKSKLKHALRRAKK